ncbi:Extracellular serine protease precursor [Serratia ficaria]|uniref:autotransporter family protein n=1 Tax=Serratia ficaria TaxID=61651 RepID=UPI00119BDD89|nr:autotransporter outer membrane beta-barrel domain-containing protein [Serratia ficaria]VVA47892.1 Extracellular serine protease precursor [Serratia ficaria]
MVNILWGYYLSPVKTRLSKLYLALAIAPLTIVGNIDLARADDVVFEGDHRITETVSYDGNVTIGSAMNDGKLLIDGGGLNAKNINVGSVGLMALRGADSFVNTQGGNIYLNLGALVIGSDAHFEYDLNEPEWVFPEIKLGKAQAPGVIDDNTVIHTSSDGFVPDSNLIFNHNSNDYELKNKIDGFATILNYAGQTTLSGDMIFFEGNITAKGGKLILNSDVNTEAFVTFKRQELTVEDGATLIINGTAGTFSPGAGLGSLAFSTSAFVKSGGVLGGKGTFGRTLVETGGHISPGDGDIGKLTIRSWLTFQDGSFYDVDIAADGRSDQLGMQGETTIGNNVKVLVNALDPHTSYQNGQSYRILSSGGGIKGMFSEAVLKSAFLDATLTRDRQYVDLAIKQKDTGGGTPGGGDGNTGGGDGNTGGGDGNTGGGDGNTGGGDGNTGGGDGNTGGGDGNTGGGDGNTGGGDGNTGGGDGNTGGGDGNAGSTGIFQTVATTGNQWTTAGALGTLAQEGPSLALYNGLLMLSASEAREAFNQLSGEQFASVQSSLQQGSMLVGNVVNQHMLTMFDDNGVLPVPPMAMSLVQGGERERNGAWGQTFGTWTRTQGDSNIGKLDSDTGGFLVGADREFSDNVRAGAYAGYSRTRFDVDNRASSGHSDNYHLGLYAGGQKDALALRGGLGYTWNRIESTRNVGFSTFSDRLSADYDANALHAFTELGYRLGNETVSAEPFANLSYMRLHTDNVEEQGGAAALRVEDETMNTFYSTLGLRGASELPLGGVDLTLHGTLGWQHAYGDTDTSARMAFATGDAFTTQGAPIDKDVAIVGAGVDVQLTRSTRIGISYQGQYGADLQANSVNAQLQVTF